MENVRTTGPAGGVGVGVGVGASVGPGVAFGVGGGVATAVGLGVGAGVGDGLGDAVGVTGRDGAGIVVVLGEAVASGAAVDPPAVGPAVGAFGVAACVVLAVGPIDDAGLDLLTTEAGGSDVAAIGVDGERLGEGMIVGVAAAAAAGVDAGEGAGPAQAARATRRPTAMAATRMRLDPRAPRAIGERLGMRRSFARRISPICWFKPAE